MKHTKLYSYFVLLLLVVLLLGISPNSTPVQAQIPTPSNQVTVYLFWGEGCPHCAKAKPYLEGLTHVYPGLTLKSYEVYYNAENQVFFQALAQKFALENMYVPTMFIGSQYLVGYAESLQPEIEAVIDECFKTGCPDSAEGIQLPSGEGAVTQGIEETVPPELTQQPAVTESSAIVESTPTPTELPRPINEKFEIELPLIGAINLDVQSIILSTILIAVVDGFNPCSLWVLSMLLALTMHTGSRKKILVIGLVFITITAVIYAMFIGGLFSVLKMTSFLGWIRVVVALIALFFAVVNIKDYFWYKEGVSLSISDEKKPGIYRRMQAVMDASQSWLGLIAATIVLAAGVSLVEFSCTAGFPVLWVNLLTTQEVSFASFFLLLLLYMFIYQIDELVIFFSAVVTLRTSRMEEKHGRILKLVGGMLMLTLSLVMLFNPALMNNLVSSLIIFGAAFLATLVVLLFHRVLLPKAGFRIGTEFKK